jgi:hypothetical protein
MLCVLSRQFGRGVDELLTFVVDTASQWADIARFRVGISPADRRPAETFEPGRRSDFVGRGSPIETGTISHALPQTGLVIIVQLKRSDATSVARASGDDSAYAKTFAAPSPASFAQRRRPSARRRGHRRDSAHSLARCGAAVSVTWRCAQRPPSTTGHTGRRQSPTIAA